MKSIHRNLSTAIIISLVLCISPLVFGQADVQARRILDATGIKGGLIVHIGCGDGRLTSALRVNGSYIVHGIDTLPANVQNARKYADSLGIYGPVSFDIFDGRHLPYVDGTVNLVVAEDSGDVSMTEVMRVLCPNGVAYIKRDGKWQRTDKPREADIDEWTHFLHDSSGNAVAKDDKVGPPKRLRWVAGPRWCRSHEFPSSVNAVVTSGGRIFTIFDEGITGIYKKMPQDCKLIARDAFNGVLLWKVPMRRWQPEFGTGTGNRWNIHHTIPRRLVAEGNRVYVTLGFLDSPVSVLDAATGKILTEALEGTKGTDEIILSDGILIAKITKGRSVAATARMDESSLHDTLAAVDVATGRELWRKENVRVMPYVLSALDGRVVYHNLEELICLSTKTGDEIWRTPNMIGSTLGAVSTLVINDDVVLFHGNGPEPNDGKTKGKNKQKRGFFLTALSLKNGNVLWRRPGHRGQAGASTQPSDLFVVKGTVWCGNSLEGYDLHTGEVVKKLEIGKLISPGHHYRCHRSKATENFLIWPKRGAEFLDLNGNNHMRNDWLRSPCFTGLTPANGLLYIPPDQCFCYPGVKIFGYMAMSAKPAEKVKPATDAHIQHGGAYGKLKTQNSKLNTNNDWPMYRRDGQRSGSTQMNVPVKLNESWTKGLTCQGSQPVIVGDRLWIAEKDFQRVRCLNAVSGRDIWSFTAGGRIDSTPTYYNGMLLFGCRDGYVYCLRAIDGELVWRFLAAPVDRRIMSYGQLESLWPVQGSVLVQDDVVYFAAGRSSFLNGGIIVYGLDTKTGRVLYSHVLEGPWPDIFKDTGEPFAMEGALPDLIVSDGKDLYMERIKFDAKLNRLETKQESFLGELDMGAIHLTATGGFLDDTGFDRLYWMYSKRWPGFYFSEHSPKAGQLIVFDKRTAYAVKYFYRRDQWSPLFIPGDQGYLLFADDVNNEPILQDKNKQPKAIDWLPKEAYSDNYRRGGRGVEKGTGYMRQFPAKWQEMVPLRVRAMVLAGDNLFAVGLPDVVDPKDPTAALKGHDGALLQVFSTKDGSLVNSLILKSPPAFDGLSAAHGHLYLATLDGKVICFGQDKQVAQR